MEVELLGTLLGIYVSDVYMYYKCRRILLFTLNVNNLFFFSNGKRQYTVMVCKSLKSFEYICSALFIYTTRIYIYTLQPTDRAM